MLLSNVIVKVILCVGVLLCFNVFAYDGLKLEVYVEC
jgi:hypothetical protein